MYSLTVLEAISPKSVSLSQNQRVGKDTLPPEALGRISHLPLPASGSCWHSLAGGLLTAISASVFTLPSPPRLGQISLGSPLIGIHLMAFRAHPDNPG